MPNISQPQRQDEPAVTDADLAALLAGTTDAVPGLRPVADVLAALTAEASSAELAGETRALAEFRHQAAMPVQPQRAPRLSSRFGVKVGASVTAAAVVLGGGAAAAFAGVLPAPIQRLAHEAIGAPIPAQRHLPDRARSVAPGQPAVPGQHFAHGKPAAHGGPGAKRSARPHATPSPTAQANPRAQGKQGSGNANQGNGQGESNGKGNGGNGKGNHGNGHGHQSNSQSQGYGQAHGPRGQAQHRNPHGRGPRGDPQARQRLAGHPRRSVRTRPIMDP